MTDLSDAFPTSVEAAVRLLQVVVPDDEQSKVAAMSRDELRALHFWLGQWVRNNLGLWGPNPTLLEATGTSNADDASEVIIYAFWQALREDLPKIH